MNGVACDQVQTAAVNPSPAAPWQNDVGTLPQGLLQAWEGVYRDYMAAAERLDTIAPQNRHVLAELSANVAVAWRRMAVSPGVEWWIGAAFNAAAEAFDQQAREWTGQWHGDPMGRPTERSAKHERPGLDLINSLSSTDVGLGR
jgi:hypothetical protein